VDEPGLFSFVFGFGFARDVVLRFVVDFAFASVLTTFFDLASFVRDTFAAPFLTFVFFTVIFARAARVFGICASLARIAR